MGRQPGYGESPGCAGTRELVPELAAGVASGEERARALAHLARCRGCRQELDAVTKVVDDLLLLAPEAEPPAGFETSVLAQLTPVRRPRRRTWKLAVLQAAALVVVAGIAAGLAAGGMLWGTADERRFAAYYRDTFAEANGSYMMVADLAAGGVPEVGHVFAYEGSPSWVLLTIEGVPAPGRYDVRLLTRGDRRVDLGRLTVRDGAAASWSSTIEVSVRDVRMVQVVPAEDAAGTTMTARFPAR